MAAHTARLVDWHTRLRVAAGDHALHPKREKTGIRPPTM
ncbi:hypothetical protein RR42_s0765 [Cupriavidus basilensis]|uniref:Uncharacterized protein n=1 Tax=Cupriavidus basilensis TaxID=68895 RepID=A0A0C4YI96_9BURK|nr:hypothetical protein RR42_s0765 [Cupriavidus basilensis]